MNHFEYDVRMFQELLREKTADQLYSIAVGLKSLYDEAIAEAMERETLDRWKRLEKLECGK